MKNELEEDMDKKCSKCGSTLFNYDTNETFCWFCFFQQNKLSEEEYDKMKKDIYAKLIKILAENIVFVEQTKILCDSNLRDLYWGDCPAYVPGYELACLELAYCIENYFYVEGPSVESMGEVFKTVSSTYAYILSQIEKIKYSIGS